MNMPLAILNRRRRGFTAFSPSTLFALAEPGVWYDPSDLTTLFQDTAGTTPVTAPGNTVALMLDKSRGLTLGPDTAVNGSFATDTGWTKDVGWTISSGKASTSGSLGYLYQNGSAAKVVGLVYKITFTVSDYVSGNVTPYISSVTPTGTPFNSNGDKTVYLRAINTSAEQGFAPPGAGSSFSIDNYVVRELAGNHATQATAASRPIYGVVPQGGRRNLLTFSEQFDNAAWQKYVMSISSNAAIAPDGTLTADLIYPSASNTDNAIYRGGFATVQKAHSVYAKASGKNWLVILQEDTTGGAAWFDLSNGVVGTTSAGYTGATIASVGGGWYRCSVASTSGFSQYTAFSAVDADNTTTVTASGTNGILIWGAQLELGSTATPYQRVTTLYDVTEAGVPSCSYLSFDGVDDFMLTGTITPGVDKAQVFAGVRKLSDAATGVIVEHSTSVSSNNGSFYLLGPNFAGQPNYDFTSKGTSFSVAVGSGFSAPITSVLTGIGDISGDRATLRANGTQVAQATTDQGTGNFLAYPLYIGRRGGSSLPFNGNLFGLITRFGPNLASTNINATEYWLNEKTGAY